MCTMADKADTETDSWQYVQNRVLLTVIMQSIVIFAARWIMQLCRGMYLTIALNGTNLTNRMLHVI